MSTTLAGVCPASDVLSFFKALADETRFTILRLLVLTDLRSGEIGERLHMPPNAVLHHLKTLRGLGLLRDHRSGADARDVYYSLDLDRLQALYTAAGDALQVAVGRDHDTEDTGGADAVADAERPLRVLFLCTHNSARSQIAEGLLRHLAGDRFGTYSGGTEATRVRPLAIRAMADLGIDISSQDGLRPGQ